MTTCANSSALSAVGSLLLRESTIARHCDCTVDCGDDPWLNDGRAFPCPRKVRDDAELAAHVLKWQRIQQAQSLATSLGYADLLEAMEHLQALKSSKD